MDKTQQRNGTRKMVAALLALPAIYVAEVFGAIIAAFFGFDFDLGVTLAGAVAAALLIVALGGGAYLRFDKHALFEAWKFMWWIILISAALMVWDLTDYISMGEIIHKGWFLRTIYALVLCLAIGVSEEGMFRGLLCGGLLARLGDRKGGIWWAVMLSSLAFGCAHVTLSDFDPNNLLTFVQGALKICQTGIYAVMLCVVMLKTKNLIGPMLVHALDDFLLFVVSTGLYGEVVETEYVVPDQDEAVAVIVFYLVIIALYMPTFIKALIELKKMSVPQYGPFYNGPEPALDALPAAGQGPVQELPWGYAQSVTYAPLPGSQQSVQQPMQQPMPQPMQQPMQQLPQQPAQNAWVHQEQEPVWTSQEPWQPAPTQAQAPMPPASRRPPRPDGLY